MLDTNNIKPEDKDIYIYLIEYVLENIIYFLFFLVCGMIFGDVFLGFILFAVLFPLRSFGGGVHAPTKRICYCISYGIVITITGIVPLIACMVTRTI